VRSRTFLHGPAGCGKTTVGVERLRFLISSGVPGSTILILTPQRTLHDPFLDFSRSPDWQSGTEAEAFTIGGLAHRLCDLFWPLVDRNRLYSQILDSLNKSAAVGFPYTEIGSRLDAAWVGDLAQRRIYAEAQECASRFREYCLQHNLLDFSLQLEIFWRHLWPDPAVQGFLRETHRHLIYDNAEEDVPRAHDLVKQWLPDLESCLLIYDEQAGYRGFLGADHESGWELRHACSNIVQLQHSFVMSAALTKSVAALESAIRQPLSIAPGLRKAAAPEPSDAAITFLRGRYFPEMLDAVASKVNELIASEQASASEVAIVGPYLSDSLRFALTIRLQALGLPVRTHRPSRSLRDEPSARALLTLAYMAHPIWNSPPPAFDVVGLFMTVLGTDLVRAHLLADIVFRKGFSLLPFEDLGRRYSELRAWLLTYRESGPQPLDYFFRRVFGEVLSQPGFGLHDRMDEVRIVGSLVESVRKFRLAMEPSILGVDHADFDVGREFMRMLEEGVLAAQYLESWRRAEQEAVLIAPAHAFLMLNRPVAFQFWLDPGSAGWFQRLDQPLTHSRVLNRSWPRDRRWNLAEEESANTDDLSRLAAGLLRRCSQQVYVCASRLGEAGFEQRGRFLLALQQVVHETEISHAN
jgi:hypothetical protein